MEPVTTNKTDPSLNGDGIYRTTFEASPQMERETWRDMAQGLYADLNTLWAKESLLIRTELDEKVNDLKGAVGSFAVGGAVLLVGLFALVATAIIALNLVAPLWLSAVIVTALLFVVGGILLGSAKKKLSANALKPRHSIETLGEIRNTFQERVHEFKKH